MTIFMRGDGYPRSSHGVLSTLRFACICLFIIAFAVPAAPSSTLAQTTTPITLTKALVSPANGDIAVGDPVVFQLTLTNTSSAAINILPLNDTFDPAYLEFTSATVAGVAATPDTQTQGTIGWTNLTLLPQVGNLAPGGSVVVLTTFKALAVTQSGGGLNPPVVSGPLGSPLPGTTVPGVVPSDYFDKESRFVIDHAIDPTNGGIYLAVRGNGTVWGTIPDVIYGFPANFFPGSTKHPGGQALCVEYFIREYQRLSDTGRTVTTTTHGVQTANDMLTWAKNCANFVNAHMIIGKGQNEPAPPSCTIGDGNKCLYYWGFVDAAGTSGQRPATGGVAGFSAPNSHHLMDSFVAWMQVELARVLKANGDPSYVTYKQAAYDFLNWAERVGAPYNSIPATASDPSFAGRDRFWAGLLMSLYELSVDEGAPDPTLRTAAIDCVNLVGVYGSNQHQRGRCNGTSYTTAYGRAAAHALELQERGVDNYYLPGAKTIWHDFGDNRYSDDPSTPNNPTVPFAHGSGRELVAGNQRAHWFYYTFPEDPDLGQNQVPAGWTTESWSRNAVLGYWNYSVQHMWDATAGQEAWWDAELRPGREGYKPCFSLGTPIPIADWKAPTIGNKVHTINPDKSATITISGVEDPSWNFLSWKFKGIGVKSVRVFYSVDNGATWTRIDASATATAGTYAATIPPQPGKTVLYYAEAEDAFGNISTFPANAPQIFQLYTLQNVTYNMAWSNGVSSIISLGIKPGPTAITLAQLNAQRGDDGVRIKWQTSSEENTYGFNIYRGSAADRSDAVRLNNAPIPARGAGSSYSFLDSAPLNAAASYWLEEVDLDGRSSWYRVPASLAPTGSLRVLLPFVRRQ